MSALAKVAAVNDLSGFGRCALTVAIPVLAAMEVQCCPIPTAILSNHTGYPSYHFTDFTDEMTAYYQEWLKLDLTFDAVYSGFLGSARQVQIVNDLTAAFRQKQIKGPWLLVDPVMGDNGKVYATYTPDMCDAMRQLVKKADIITPNLTEAAILLARDYTGEGISLATGDEIAKALSELGPKAVVLTGVKPGENQVWSLAYDKAKDQMFHIARPLVKQHYNGTGDLFASVLCGALVQGEELANAVEMAADFVYRCTLYTAEQNGDTVDGVYFEKLLNSINQKNKN
jgi:pyridoxine kinase